MPDDKPPFPDDRDPFVDRPFLFLEDHDFHDDDFHDDDRIIVVPTQPVEPPEPEDAADAPVEPPAPPDPRGPKFVPVRGAAGAQPYSVGEPLPEDVPFVKLDWSRYGLPEPPPGLIYARVGGEVLLIDPVSRIVERRVDPAKLEAADSG